jgi:hypothetical protein
MKATMGLVDLLNPLDSQERKRVVQAAFALLGDTVPAAKEAAESGEADEENNKGLAVSTKAKLWMKQNGVTGQALEQIFHLEGGTAGFIGGEMPGKSDKEKSLNAYVICGLASFLATGEPKFTDQQARKLCTDAGCYDPNNHGTYIKAKGNSFVGSKEKGWALTAPGLKAAAKIVQDLTAAKE